MKHIARRAQKQVVAALRRTPCVILVGARQVGKTTLARRIAAEMPSRFYDLEKTDDCACLQNAHDELGRQEGRLVIIDEAQNMPDIFAALRVLIDERRAKGMRTGQFLILGSADERLVDRGAESLTGRCERIQMHGIDCLEAGADDMHLLWKRGGYPESYLAASDSDSRRWRINYIENQIRREMPAMAIGIVNRPAMMNIWRLIAAAGIGQINAASMAGKLQVSAPTVGRYLQILDDLFLIRRLPAYGVNLSRHIVKSPKYYVRDSGLAAAMNNREPSASESDLAGLSWQAFATENIISMLPPLWQAFHYQTRQKGEIDLIIENLGQLWAIEIKLSPPSSLPSGMARSLAALQAERSFVVHSGTEIRRLQSGAEVMSLPAIMKELAAQDD